MISLREYQQAWVRTITCLLYIRCFLYKKSRIGNNSKKSQKTRGTWGQTSFIDKELLKKTLLERCGKIGTKKIRLLGVIRSSVVGFWRRLLAFEAATAWNRGTPCKMFKFTNIMFFFLLIRDFHHLIKQMIKDTISVNLMGKYVGHWGSYSLKQGNYLQNFQINNQVILFLFPFLWFSFLY